MNIFYKKTSALEYLKKNPNKDLKLFSEDIDVDSKKRFIVTDYKTIYQESYRNKINHNKSNSRGCSYYENIEKNQKVKLHLDIDHKKDNNDTNENIINDIIIMVNKKLEEHNIINPSIIILSANTSKKNSYHIIYTNVVFNDIYQMKEFMMEIKPFHNNDNNLNNIFEQKILDLRIYRTGCFRMLWSRKINKDNTLVWLKGINYDYKDDESLFYDTLLLNIKDPVHIIEYKSDTINDKINNKIKTKICFKIDLVNDMIQNGEINDCEMDNFLDHNFSQSSDTNSYKNIYQNTYTNKLDLSTIQKYVNCLNPERANDYNDWLEIGMCLHHINRDSFEIWNEWSKHSSNYSSTIDCKYKWDSFDTRKELGLSRLKLRAKQDNPIEYSYIDTNRIIKKTEKASV